MKYPEDFINQIICGDCMEVMKDIPDNSIDTIITDPPYGLEFMGKDWDRFKENEEFQKWNYLWTKEALRVAKPGATLLCFGGSRTFHRLACAIEDAGFIIKDCIMWIYGSGFPKATDIAKQIAKKQGAKKQGAKKQGAGSKGNTFPLNKEYQDYELTPEAQLWNGWKSHSLKPAYEPIIVAMKPNDGSYAENALKWGVSGLNIEEARISYKNDEDKKSGQSARPSLTKDTMFSMGGLDRSQRDNIQGRFPANLILDKEASEELDKQSGVSASSSSYRQPDKGGTGNSLTFLHKIGENRGYTDVGGASRFFKVINDDEDNFPRFIYCPKASGNERTCNGVIKNNHPTVKPLKLMEYLCILTKTPTGGIVLDPFVGSGTICMAAKKVGRNFIGIEKEEDYCSIARVRIEAIEPNLL